MKVIDKKFYKCLDQILVDCIEEADSEFESNEMTVEYKDFFMKIILDLRSIFKHRKITLKNTEKLYDFLETRENAFKDEVITNFEKMEEWKKDGYTKDYKYVYEFLSTYLIFRRIKKDLHECKHNFFVNEYGDSKVQDENNDIKEGK